MYRPGMEISALFHAHYHIKATEVFELLGMLQLRLERVLAPEGYSVSVRLPLRLRAPEEPTDLDVRITLEGRCDLAVVRAVAEEFAPRGCPVEVKVVEKLETGEGPGNVPDHETPVLN